MTIWASGHGRRTSSYRESLSPIARLTPIFSTNLVATNRNKSLPLTLARRSNPSRLIPDPSTNSNGSSSSLPLHMWTFCRENLDCCLDNTTDTSSGIKSKCSLGRNQRRYRSPNRLSDGHSGVYCLPGVAEVPRWFAWTGCTTSDCKTFTPNEEG